MSEASVIIANFNGAHLLKKYLPSVISQQDINYEVIVVDNASIDGSRDLLKSSFPKVRLISLNENKGFSTAVNVGIAAAKSDLIALLNNDASPDPLWLKTLVTNAADHPTIGMFASRMMFAHQPEIVNSTGIEIDRAGIAWDRDSCSRTIGPNAEVFGPCGGAGLYRRKLFEDIGLFDEQFFAYLEDVDLAWRAQSKGWRCLYISNAVVMHEHSATASEGSPFKNFHLGRNKIWTIAKNYPFGLLLLYMPAILFFDLGSIPYTILSQRDLSGVKGRVSAIKGMKSIMSKRSFIQSETTITWNELRGLMQPMQAPWRLFQRYKTLSTVLKMPRI